MQDMTVAINNMNAPLLYVDMVFAAGKTSRERVQQPEFSFKLANGTPIARCSI